MKLKISVVLFLFTSFIFANNTPVLLFSDIESGPNTGWSDAFPNRGVAVTIWGYDFGTQRGSSFVTVNGVDLISDNDYAVWGENWPTPFYQKTTFWLTNQMSAGLGNITVTVNGVQSNPLPFTIRNGSIFFITANNSGGNGTINNPFDIDNSDSDWVKNMSPGDVYYFRDQNIYSQRSNGGNSTIWIRSSEQSGTAQLPIALLAYPNEKPTFSIETYSVNFNKAIKFDNAYMVYSGFSIDSEWAGADLGGDNHRLIGNDLIGLKNKHGSGTGTIVTGGSGNVVLGNAVHGGGSKDRYDHAIYISGCADNGGTELGWNYCYDNDFGRGPILSINHQQERCTGSQVLDAHFIFNNIVDCSLQRAVAINVYDLSYDTGEIAPEPTYVYNNLFINSGTYDGSDLSNTGYAPSVIHNAVGDVRFYNNTLYNSGYVGFSIGDNVTSTYIKNNIIFMSSNFPGPTGNHYTIVKNGSNVHLSNNLYYGLGDYTNCTNCAQDANNINNQNPLFVNPVNIKFELQENSPAIDAGTSDLVFEVEPPQYAPIDRDLKFVLRNFNPSIGAFEYNSSTLSIDESNLSEIVLFPNPTKDYLQIKTDHEILKLEIYNTIGQLVTTIDAPNKRIPVKLSSGVYLITVKTTDNKIFKQKIIIE